MSTNSERASRIGQSHPMGFWTIRRVESCRPEPRWSQAESNRDDSTFAKPPMHPSSEREGIVSNRVGPVRGRSSGNCARSALMVVLLPNPLEIRDSPSVGGIRRYKSAWATSPSIHPSDRIRSVLPFKIKTRARTTRRDGSDEGGGGTTAR